MGKKREIQDGGGQPSKKRQIQKGVGEASFLKFLWMIEDIPKKVKENVGDYSHQNLKVVELIGYIGARYEIQLVLHLVEIAASLEKLVIDVCVPAIWWPEEDTLNYK